MEEFKVEKFLDLMCRGDTEKIVEYEQKGRDHAKYGERLLKRLEERLNCRGLNETLFKVSRQFYLEYPQIRTLFDTRKNATASHESGKGAMPSHQFMTPPEKIVSKLSFSHIREIMTKQNVSKGVGR